MRVIEPYHDSYRDPWYLVKKSISGKYWVIKVLVELNQVTVRDANLPLSVDKFSEELASYIVLSLINFLSDYDQVELVEESNQLITFITPLNQLQMTTLTQGATNLVTQFVKIIFKIIAPHLQD